MAMQDRPAVAGGLGSLFDSASAPDAHTSGWALTSLLAGLGAGLAAPFSLTSGLALCLGLIGSVLALAGIATTSRPGVAGGALAPVGLLLSLVAVVLVGLRYLGVDNAVGDALLPSLQALLEQLNAQVGIG